MVYAIRSRDDPSGGVVFSNYAEARGWYITKQNAGLCPVMVTGASLTAAVNCAECFPDLDPNAAVRRDLVEEENKARRQKVSADLKRAKHRRGVLETLQGRREDVGSESEHDSDTSDVSRSTASLESELNARLSYGDEWRYYRGHGKN
jgi:hypothetical protein